VDAERFMRELPLLWDDFPRSELPRDPRFAEVLEALDGLARPNNVALLNLAAACREPGESYVEVGTYRGTSLVAALLGNDGDFVAIDDFSLGDGNREALEANLARFGVAGRAEILEGDAFELLRGDALAGRRVGVYYYDNGHEYEQQLDGLRLIEPYLAERALLIVDDSDWERVERATRDYLAGQPRARALLWIDGKEKGMPWWWEGMAILEWDGPTGTNRLF
jgi:predicted O-methyltransferase YrrM